MRAAILCLAAALGAGAWLAACTAPDPAPEPPPAAAMTTLRVATYNVSLYGEEAGAVLVRLAGGRDRQARRVAAVLQHLRPDLLLLNEVDYDEGGRLADLLQREYLEVGQFGEAPIHYPYRFLAPVNTGVPSGMDLNRDGRIGGHGREHGDDAFGYGLYPGQYGMLVLSRFPIAMDEVRTFQRLPWAALPGARRPIDPVGGGWWYDDAVWPRLRLSSKSHWDVPVDTPLGRLHFLVSHPTPPVFDGEENRNGLRNADELALWRHYLDGGEAPWLCDDQGRCGGLPPGARFVIAGDLNNDPADGNGLREAIVELLEHPRVLRLRTPESRGAVAAARRYPELPRRGNPAHATGDFGPGSGTLRLDYVLPSTGFDVRASGVFWPLPGETGADWIEASDHHPVWVDLAGPEALP
ncbi:endonuclease/exonuclease/phosphatase family protein [Silanimonas lenta]|uniref:endonuclease/exonuclease/phosphatase family protein n=1 Tax=Silanimonas lenta TaxID=265429 RepID=UPI003D1037E8